MYDGDGAMELNKEVKECLYKARHFVLDGGSQIITGKVDEEFGISPSCGATALATLALLALGRGFEAAQYRGTLWLRQHRQAQGWGKFPGDAADEEVTRLVKTVLQGSQGGWIGRIRLLAQTRQFSQMILSLGQRVVPGLEGPRPDEIKLPRILEPQVLMKLPQYGRPVVVAASLLAPNDNNHKGVGQAIQYLVDCQMQDGAWSEDIVATSLAILALVRYRGNAESLNLAGQWLVSKQYASGGWPAFDQLYNWAVGWATNIFAETPKSQEEIIWMEKAIPWLRAGKNKDGSYGSTPPFTHPDLDDTAVALMGLNSALRESSVSAQLLRQLQNEDGSWSTFPSFKGVPPNIQCDFPVYIPSADVTIHVLEALWRQGSRTSDESINRGLNWLISQQKEDGEFPAVWFEGPIYGTAQAVELLSKWRFSWGQWKSARQILNAKRKGQELLLALQKTDGSWGDSVIETSLALSALGSYGKAVPSDVFDQGIRSIINCQQANGSFQPTYQGIYAKGWNYEEPLAAALTAIRAMERYRLLMS